MAFAAVERFKSFSSDFAATPKRARVHFAPADAFTGARYDGDSPSSSEDVDRAPLKENMNTRGHFAQEDGIRQEAVEHDFWDATCWAASRRYGYVGRKARKVRVKVRRLMKRFWTGSSTASGE